jgi:hypothetical protein
VASTRSTQNKNPEPCRPVMTSNSDPWVSISAGFPMGIPVVSHRWATLMLSLTYTSLIDSSSAHTIKGSLNKVKKCLTLWNLVSIMANHKITEHRGWVQECCAWCICHLHLIIGQHLQVWISSNVRVGLRKLKDSWESLRSKQVRWLLFG